MQANKWYRNITLFLSATLVLACILIINGCTLSGTLKQTISSAQYKQKPGVTHVVYSEDFGVTDSLGVPTKSRIIDINLSKKKKKTLLECNGQVRWLNASPDNSELVYTVGEQKIEILDIKNNKKQKIISHASKNTFIDKNGVEHKNNICSCTEEYYRTPIWSFDSSKISYITIHCLDNMNWSSLDTIDLRTGEITQVAIKDKLMESASLIAWVPNADKIIFDYSQNWERASSDLGAAYGILAILDRSTLKAKRISDGGTFAGLSTPTELVYQVIVTPDYNSTRYMLDPIQDILTNVVLLDSANKANKSKVKVINKWITKYDSYTIVSNNKVFYIQHLPSANNQASYINAVEYGRSIREIQGIYYIDLNTGARSLISDQNGFLVQKLFVSPDDEYIVFFRQPFSGDAMDPELFSHIELVAVNTRTKKESIFATSKPEPRYIPDPNSINQEYPNPFSINTEQLATYIER